MTDYNWVEKMGSGARHFKVGDPIPHPLPPRDADAERIEDLEKQLERMYRIVDALTEDR